MSSNLIPYIILLYILIGSFIGANLHHKGQSTATALSAILAWPLLVGSTPTGNGPLSSKIMAAFSALESAATETSAKGLISNEEVNALRHHLLLADGRLAIVDRLLQDPQLSRSGEKLKQARERAAAEISEALEEVIELRIQMGLVTLAGDTGPVRERMTALRARIHALEEIGLS